jgi:hypothetical protein
MNRNSRLSSDPERFITDYVPERNYQRSPELPALVSSQTPLGVSPEFIKYGSKALEGMSRHVQPT